MEAEEQKMEAEKPRLLGRVESATWGGTLELGVLWAIVGVLCLAASAVAGVAAMHYVGVFLAIGGVVSLISNFRGAGSGAAVLGILSLFVGVRLLYHPAGGLVSLTALPIGYFFIAGLFQVVISLAERYQGWGYDCISGLCAIAAGLIAIAVRSRPVSNFWLVGALFGAELLIRGALKMAAAVSARHVMRDIRTAA
jgi:uncharacterized membrane protein HdeD (DUF308 family)